MEFDARDLAKRLREHLVADILPFWGAHALDRELGGYHSELLADGRPGRRRRKSLAMQARMVDAFIAGMKISGEPAYLDCARHGVEFLVGAMYQPEDSQWICGVERDGTPVEERMRTFDLAAVVQGLSSYGAAAKDSHSMSLALEAYGQLEGFFRDKRYGGYYERIGPEREVDRTSKSLDAHLHVIEALMELTTNSHEIEHELALRRDLAILIHRTQGEEVLPLFEKYTEEWEEHGTDAPRIKYGHLLKTAWMYLEAYREFDKQAYLDFARWQMDYALQVGMDPRGGVYYSGNANGEILNSHRPWWAQCEAIAALARAWTIQHRDEDARLLLRQVDYCLEHFHDKQHGEWFAMIGPRNEVVDSRKAHETKCAYPIIRSLTRAVEDLETH